MRRFVFVFVAVWLLVLAFVYAALAPDRDTDFTSFYLAAEAIGTGHNPYSVHGLHKLGAGLRVWPYVYSPLVAILFTPLTHWGLGAALYYWMYCATAGFALTTAIATQRSRMPTIHAIAFSVLIGIGLNLFNTIDIAQINTVVLVPITLAFVLRERRPVLAGACIAIAGVAKASPFYLLVVFAAERRWRMLAAAAAATLVIVALTVPIVGLKTWESFFILGRRVSAELAIPGLFALDGQYSFSVIAMLMRAGVDPHVFAPVVTLGLTVPIVLAAWRGRKGTLLSALAVMILSAPVAYSQHVIYLFPGVLSAFADATARKRTVYATVLLVAAFTAGIDFPLSDHAGCSFAAVLGVYVVGFFA